MVILEVTFLFVYYFTYYFEGNQNHRSLCLKKLPLLNKVELFDFRQFLDTYGKIKSYVQVFFELPLVGLKYYIFHECTRNDCGVEKESFNDILLSFAFSVYSIVSTLVGIYFFATAQGVSVPRFLSLLFNGFGGLPILKIKKGSTDDDIMHLDLSKKHRLSIDSIQMLSKGKYTSYPIHPYFALS